MGSTLRILALEPYYGGMRRQVLQTIVRLSRHDWTLLKLPPRRVERRLAAASRWFAEIIHRDGFDQDCDLLFTGEMLNLPDLLRAVPRLAGRPSVAYFQDNQTPTADDLTGSPLEFVNLNTAMAATEVWFNSQWHLDQFLTRADSLVKRQAEIRGRSPVSELRHKSQVVLPPFDLGKVFDAWTGRGRIDRDPRTILVDLRGADSSLLVECLRRLDLRNEPLNLITVGSCKALSDNLRHRTIHERDEVAQMRALQEAGVFLSLRYGAPTDELVVAALSAGCWPVVPDLGIYSELLSPLLHLCCLHDGSVESIVSRILDAWYVERPLGYENDQQELLASVDASRSCRVIDEMLEEVASGRPIATQ